MPKSWGAIDLNGNIDEKTYLQVQNKQTFISFIAFYIFQIQDQTCKMFDNHAFLSDFFLDH